MTSALFLLLQASLLAALLQPIICPSRESLASRQDRASHIDTNNFNSFDNSENYMGNPIRETQSRNHQRRQQQSTDEEPNKGLNNEKLYDIFNIGSGKGVVLFTSPTRSYDPVDDAEFKVQRNPEDGKLNVVVNDYLIFQTTTAATTRPSQNRDFRLPDQLYANSPVCKEGYSEGMPFCTKVQNYPKLNELENILSGELPRFETFFGEDIEPPPRNISTRFMNGEPDEEYLCDSDSSIIYPEAAMTKDSNWLLVVNNYEQYKQGVRIETCKKDGAQCKQMDSLPNRYKAICKQTYIYRKLVAITPNGTITKDNFKMPACCKCVLKQF